MTEVNLVDYGPLRDLIGTWNGDKGIDIAPDPDGDEVNPYYETITFDAVGDVTNAESQTLAILFYRQIVRRKSNQEIFHDQTGYWLWDSQSKTVMHSLTIPRAVAVLAGGAYNDELSKEGATILEVSASLEDPDWGIVQSPFMRDKAKTKAFKQRIEVGGGKLKYHETSVVDIYGKTFEHTDENELIKEG